MVHDDGDGGDDDDDNNDDDDDDDGTIRLQAVLCCVNECQLSILVFFNSSMHVDGQPVSPSLSVSLSVSVCVLLSVSQCLSL